MNKLDYQIKEYVEQNYLGWALKMKKTGIYLKFIAEHTALNFTTPQIFTLIDQEYQTYDDNFQNLN